MTLAATPSMAGEISALRMRRSLMLRGGCNAAAMGDHKSHIVDVTSFNTALRRSVKRRERDNRRPTTDRWNGSRAAFGSKRC
jgi:hypothetical protein